MLEGDIRPDSNGKAMMAHGHGDSDGDAFGAMARDPQGPLGEHRYLWPWLGLAQVAS